MAIKKTETVFPLGGNQACVVRIEADHRNLFSDYGKELIKTAVVEAAIADAVMSANGGGDTFCNTDTTRKGLISAAACEINRLLIEAISGITQDHINKRIKELKNIGKG